jgi:phosphatidylglycerophosphate synthase
MGFIKEAFSTVPNLISMSRLVLVVPLWFWAYQGKYSWVAWGLILIALTDILDGMVARIFDQCSEIGENLDSWADHIILVSGVIWLFLFLRDFFPADRLLWMIPAIIFFVVTAVIGLIKNRKFAGAHLLEGKILAVFGYLGLVSFMFGFYSDVIFGLMIGSWIVHSIVNLIFHFRPDLFNIRQRSLILGLLGIEFEDGLIRYFFS